MNQVVVKESAAFIVPSKTSRKLILKGPKSLKPFRERFLKTVKEGVMGYVIRSWTFFFDWLVVR